MGRRVQRFTFWGFSLQIPGVYQVSAEVSYFVLSAGISLSLLWDGTGSHVSKGKNGQDGKPADRAALKRRARA